MKMVLHQKRIRIKKTVKGFLFIIYSGLFFLSLISFLQCSASEKASKEEKELVWPLPPEKPRIKYLQSLSDRKSIEGSGSKFLESLLGEEKSDALQKPYGVAVDKNDKVYVTESNGGKIFVFDLKNSKLTFIMNGSLIMPIGVAVDSLNNIYVSDVKLKTVLVFDAKGELKRSFGENGEIENPAGLAIDTKLKRIYVSDSKAHAVKIYTLDGKFIFSFGKRGSGDGEFNYPTNIAIDKNGNIYVVDTMNARVEVFNSEGKYLWKFGSLGDSPGQFTRPKGIALDSQENIYVVDAAFNNFQIFDKEGKLLMHVGGLGKEPGNFWLPAGIYIDKDDRIFVVDPSNSRVQIFQLIKYSE